MATINPTVKNGVATLPARKSSPYFYQEIIQVTANGVTKNVLAGRPRMTEAVTISGKTLVAGDTWQDVINQLQSLGINTTKLTAPTS